jgi:hypothetical protein
LFIGAIPLRDGQQFTNPATRINSLRIVHGCIMNYTARLVQLYGANTLKHGF